MKYLIVIVLLVSSCSNSSDQKATTYYSDPAFDSLVKQSDSDYQKLAALDTSVSKVVADYKETYSQVKELRQQKKDLLNQLEQKYPNFQAIQSDDGNLAKVNELNNKLVVLEFELARLRRDSAYNAYKSKFQLGNNRLEKLIEPDFIVPDERSLIIDLDKRMRGDGRISDSKINVYLLDYDKKKSKGLMSYDAACDMSKLNKLNPKKAMYYNGLFFFNGVAKGKYLVKICSLYGNYQVIDYDGSKQVVAMQVAPPIQ